MSEGPGLEKGQPTHFRKLSELNLLPVATTWQRADRSQLTPFFDTQEQFTPSIPLTLTNVKVVMNEPRYDVYYSLRNDDPQAKLVAAELWWDLYTGDLQPARVISYVDAYFSGVSDLPPSSIVSMSDDGLYFSFEGSKQVQKMIVTIAYAEFSDGRKLGEDESGFSAFLWKLRNEVASFRAQILSAYRAQGGTKESLLGAIRQTRLASSLPEVQFERTFLFKVFDQGGVQGVLNILSRSLPQAR